MVSSAWFMVKNGLWFMVDSWWLFEVTPFIMSFRGAIATRNLVLYPHSLRYGDSSPYASIHRFARFQLGSLRLLTFEVTTRVQCSVGWLVFLKGIGWCLIQLRPLTYTTTPRAISNERKKLIDIIEYRGCSQKEVYSSCTGFFPQTSLTLLKIKWFKTSRITTRFFCICQ